MAIAFISHPACLRHEMGDGHPERPERLSAIEDKLLASRLDYLIVRADAPAAMREQLLIVDFDVHHGNGTEDIFRDDPRVLMVSTFQHPFYPGSGVEGRSERMVNVPLQGSSPAASRPTSSSSPFDRACSPQIVRGVSRASCSLRSFPGS